MGDAIARERRADEAGAAGIRDRRKRIVDGRKRAVRVAGIREIALALQQRRDVGDIGAGVALAASLISAEEEELLGLPDRTAQRSAELVALEQRALQSGAVVGPGVGVQLVVAQILEGGAVEVVRSAAGDHIHCAAVGFAELRVELIALNVDLLHGIDAGRGDQPAPIHCRGRHSIDQCESCLASPAIHGETVMILILRRLRDAGSHGDDAGVDVHELERVSRVDRQIEHGLLVERHRAVSGLGVEQCDATGDFHDLVDGPQLQREVYFERLIHAQHHARLHRFSESLHFRAELVAPRNQLGEYVEPIDSGGDLPRFPVCLVASVHGGVWNPGRVRVGDHSRYGAGVRLAQGRLNRRERTKRKRENKSVGFRHGKILP